MLEPTDVITCVECGKPITTDTGVLAGEKFGHDNAIGMCKACISTAHYLLHRKDIDKDLTIDEYMLNAIVDEAISTGLACIVFDIDGTLCNEKLFNLVDERSKRSVLYFPEMAAVAKKLFDRGITIVYLSARMNTYRSLTETQLIDNGFPLTTLILYDGDPNDVNFPVTTTIWKNDIIRRLFNDNENMLIVDDSKHFLDNLEMFIYPRDIFHIISIGRCSIAVIRR